MIPILIHVFYVFGCSVYMYVYVPHVYLPDVQRGQNRALDPLKLELQTVVSHYVGAGDGAQVLWKISSKMQNHLSSPPPQGTIRGLATCITIDVILHDYWTTLLKYTQSKSNSIILR